MMTATTTMLRCLLFAVFTTATTTAQQYEINWDPLNPYIGDGDRFLQTQPTCTVSGSRFICDIATEVRSQGNATNANATVTLAANLNCEFSAQAQIDYRKATGCTCAAQILSADQAPRTCPCLLCPSGFGNNPVSVDCDYDTRPPEVDPFIVGPCTSFDCSFACNGTCSFGCEEPIAPECQQMCVGSQAPGQVPAEEFSSVDSGVSIASSATALAVVFASLVWMRQ